MNVLGTSDSRSRWNVYAVAMVLVACSPGVARAETPLKETPIIVDMGTLVPVSHSISKTKFCVGEPVTARMRSLSSDRTDDHINYVIGGVPGNVVALTYDKPGDHQVLFAASDGKAIDQQSIEVNVRDCGSSFEYVTVQAAPLAFKNDTFLYTAGVRSSGPIGRDNRSKRFLKAREVTYEWKFGDGTTETTKVPYVEHSYAQRDERSTLNSTFIITVKAHANGLPTPIGKTTVTLPNMYKANLNNGKIVPNVVPARAVAQAGGGYTAKLEVNNLEDVSLDLSSANVMLIACDGTDSDENTADVTSIFSMARLPPGKSSIDVTIPAGATTADTCRMRYEVTGKSADGRPVVLVAAVFVRDPPVGRVDTATPEYRARVKVVEAAMRALGRVDAHGSLSGTISDAEIFELQLKGILSDPGQPAAEPNNPCGSCAPNQICAIVAQAGIVDAWGHGTYAVKGDVALLRNPTGEITPIINALGEYWTHTGIMVDGSSCRSDLMGGQAGTPLADLVKHDTPSAVTQWVGQVFCSVGNPAVGDLKISPADLYQGSPGVITQTMYDSSYFYPYVVYLAQPAGSALTKYSPRWTMRAAADTANGISQLYGIYNYSDYNYTVKQGHEGCSGFVMLALQKTTAKTLPDFDLNTYSADIRQKAAQAMYDGLYGSCGLPTGGGVSDLIYQTLVAKKCNHNNPAACEKGTLTQCQICKLQKSCNGVGTGIAQWTEGLLNQVINCFAFGDVGNGGIQQCSATNSTAWHNPGTGSGTISPQSVYKQMNEKYSAIYKQEVLYPTVWGTIPVWGCVAQKVIVNNSVN